MSLLCSPSPNAILRELRSKQSNREIIKTAKRIGMQHDERALYGTSEQWQQLRLNDLLFGG